MDFLNMILSMDPRMWQQMAQALSQPIATPTFRPPPQPSTPSPAAPTALVGGSAAGDPNANFLRELFLGQQGIGP